MKRSSLEWIVFVIVIIGGLNWGLIGAFNVDLVRIIFETVPVLQRTVYVLVGIATVYMIYILIKDNK
ncbi:MAG: DUF378 domain-containing protein [Nanoarchaeota archaeon]